MRINDGMKCYGSKISPRMWIDSNGQLVCVGAVVARTGSYQYLESEIKEGGDPNTVVEVFRTPEEVFNPMAMASFENKPFCDNHPDDDVTLDNYKDLQKGFMRNIRRGTGDLSDCLLADIIVTDKDTINEIRRGDKRELSLGYDTNLEQDESGRWVMKNIRGNHLALVDSGRAGCATIRDSAGKLKNSIGGTNMKLFGKTAPVARHRLYDEDIVKVEELVEDDDDIQLEELPAEEPQKPVDIPAEDVIEGDKIPEEPVHDDEESGPIWDAIHAIQARLDEIAKMVAPQEDIPAEEEPIEDDVDDLTLEEPADDMSEDVDASEDDIDLDEEGDDADEESSDEEGELLDADEAEVQKTVEEPIRDATMKSKDAKSVYAQFAKMSDSTSQTKLSDAEQAQLIWQARYDNASKKIK